ncbi:unnamed protein product [Prorocentrum cordatum]|uniref:Uncharacterized protein n=1 Tax=Prorocentrum cordatum TaxID=2364126 RepID=A0ABN9Y2B0_9DINO|nr:unnamed protein product [Polarella glacialis]
MSAPTTYEEQLSVLIAFYRRHDSSKGGEGCRAILDKRRGEAPVVAPSDFTELCAKLQQKYGENPLRPPGASREVDGAVPVTLNAQVAALDAFYARHDPAKVGESCRAIVDKRRGAEPAMRPDDFRDLCAKLQQKYGESPLLSPARTEVTKPATPSRAAAAAGLVASAVRDAAPSGAAAGDAGTPSSAAGGATASPGAAVLAAAEVSSSPYAGAGTPPGAVAATAAGRGSPSAGAAKTPSASSGSRAAESAAPPGACAAEAPAGVSAPAGAAGPDAAGAATPSMAAEQAAASCASPTANGSGGVPSTLASQFAVLDRFYAKYDRAKAGDSCRAILDTRRGANPAMRPSDFAELCAKLQQKYGENPLAPRAAHSNGSAAAVGVATYASAGHGVVPLTYEAQLSILDSFYANCDKQKVGAGTKAILDQRRGASPALELGAFAELCCKIADKYDASPLEAPVPADAQAQLASLNRFYATHDSSKVGAGSQAILDARRGGNPTLGRAAFLELCWRLQAKYGENPLLA